MRAEAIILRVLFWASLPMAALLYVLGDVDGAVAATALGTACLALARTVDDEDGGSR
jgi:hypothetical protein